MFQTNLWHFSHPSAWEDPYETHITNSLSNTLFAQCWCRNGVSDAMWRIYSQDRLGVRIRTTEEKLASALLQATTKRKLGFRTAKVKYVNELEYVVHAARIRAELQSNVTFVRASAHLFLKRVAFSHEAETRVVVFDPSQTTEANASGIKIELNSRELIDSVLVDPRAPEEFVAAYKHYLQEHLKFAGSVKKSQLYRSGEKREV
jgi:hypothetical protein